MSSIPPSVEPVDLLFVCIGNLCRSPFAEAVARAKAPSTVRIASAGLWAVVGGGVPPEGRAVASERGYDVLAHRAQQLDELLVDRARRIVVMERAQAREVEQRFEVDGDRVEVLARWIPGPLRPEDIADPYGSPAWAYETCYVLIEDAVEALLAAWPSRHPSR